MKALPFLYILSSALMLSSCFSESSDNFDTDGDGMLDKYDACPFDPNKYASEGKCGCGNIERTIGDEVRCIYNVAGDSDFDGVADSEDDCPNKPFKFTPGYCGCERYDLDADNDGVVDSCEMLPDDDENTFKDMTFPDKCPGKPKIVPGFCDCDYADLDSDGDTYVDDCEKGAVLPDVFPDRCPTDRDKHERGICGCGTPDDDSDGDDSPDCIDECPNDPEKIVAGLCGCGESETDTDHDKTPDCIDLCPNDPDKSHPGICGCGNSDISDVDNDGHIDCEDLCPNDPNKFEPGACGCGNLDEDLNRNGVIDCLEPCPAGSLLEGSIPGVCGCDMRDDDSDDDGVLDCLDLCPSNPAKSDDEGLCGCDYEIEEDTDGDKIPDCIDACPDDPLKTDSEGSCGCGNLETDMDGDGTPDCVDLCPDDPSKTEPGECGCGLHAIVETTTGEDDEEIKTSFCPAQGGLVSLDTMFPGTSMHEQDNQVAIMERYLKRTTPNHDVYAYFIPAGNALVDPHLLYLDKFWYVQWGLFRYAVFTDEYLGPRPFPQYPVYIGGTDGGHDFIKQTVTNPYANIRDITVRMGVLGGTTYKNFGTDSYDINDNYYSCEEYDFNFFTTTEVISKNSNSFDVTFTSNSGTIDGYDSSYSNGAALQGFQVFFGDPEVRFSTDGNTWTDWMTYDESADEMWRTKITLPEGYGYRYVYMQTRNATLPPAAPETEPEKNISANYIYYETSNRIMVKDPNHDAVLQIGVFKPESVLATKEDIEKEFAVRKTSNQIVNLYYTSGNILLDDPTFEDTSDSKWVTQNTKVTWEMDHPRAFVLLPELSMQDASYISQRLLIPEKYRGESCEISFWATADVNQSILAKLRMFDENGIILDYGEKEIPYTTLYSVDNLKLYSLKTNFLDETASIILNITTNTSDDTSAYIQSVRIGAGKSYVRFSNDQKQWSTWEEATGIKYNWTLDDCTPSDDDATKQTCTVTMQTFDLVTREFSEASASIIYQPEAVEPEPEPEPEP